MLNLANCKINRGREELYTDVRLNDVLCERYQVHMEQYGRKVLKRHNKVLTASSDIGMLSSIVYFLGRLMLILSIVTHRKRELRDTYLAYYVWNPHAGKYIPTSPHIHCLGWNG